MQDPSKPVGEPPQGVVVLDATAAELVVEGAGAVRWQVSTDHGATWTTFPGVTSGTLTIRDAALGQSGSWDRAVFTSQAGSVTTRAARLTVTAPEVPVTG